MLFWKINLSDFNKPYDVIYQAINRKVNFNMISSSNIEVGLLLLGQTLTITQHKCLNTYIFIQCSFIATFFSIKWTK